MSLINIRKNNVDIKRQARNLIFKIENEEDEELGLKRTERNRIITLLKNTELDMIYELIHNKEYVAKFNYEILADLDEKIEFLHDNISLIKEDIDLDKFFNDGKILDFKKLKRLYDKKQLKKKYLDFDFKRYKELVNNPVRELPNYKGENILYDKFLVKKIILAINQMLFDEMDMYILVTGKEGSGKSCFTSQVMYYFWWFLKEIKLISYDFDFKEMFFSNINNFLEAQDMQTDTDYFRIMNLDEGNKLNRMNYREPTSLVFKQGMRTDRKLQRIVFVNIQQLGELDVTITLSRANFLFDCKMDNVIKTGTLQKGIVDFFIFPRGKKIFSEHYKKNLTDSEIKNRFSQHLEKKGNYYTDLPKECLIKKLNFKEVWAIDREKYAKYIKVENKKERVTGQIKTSQYLAYILFKKLPAIKNWGTFDIKNNRKDRKMYYTVNRWMKYIERLFTEYHPELLKKFDIIYGEDE